MTTSRGRGRRRWRVLGAVGVALMGYTLGPRAKVDKPRFVYNAHTTYGLTGSDTLATLPAIVDSVEARAGVTDTAVRKRVRFANAEAPMRTPWSVVYLHGFSATRQETAPLAEQVASALGANLFETRLTGHGLPGDSLARVTARQWIEDAEDAMRIGAWLGDSVLLIGTSTGGTLAAWLASDARATRPALARIVLISPNFGPRDAAAAILTMPFAEQILTPFIPTRSWTAMNPEHARYWTTTYPSHALFPMQALVEATRDRNLTDYDTPTLVVFSATDSVVDPKRTRTWMRRLHDDMPKTPLDSLLVVPRAREDDHVIVGRITAPTQVAPVRDAIVSFVRR